jgi:hypothetical protein
MEATKARANKGLNWRIGVLLLLCALIPARAQETTEAASRGFTLHEATFYSSYYSVGVPDYLIGAGVPLLSRGYDIGIGGSAILGYSNQGERSSLHFRYTPSYTGRVRYSDLAAFSNSMDLQFGRSITPRSRFSLGVAGSVMNREEIQFGALRAASAPTEVSATNPAVTGDPAAQSLFFGSRILSVNARAGLQHAISPRLTLNTGLGGMRMQYLSNRSFAGNDTPVLVPHVTSGLGDVGLSYRLNPRTNVGLAFEAVNQRSRVQNSIITNLRATADRALTPRFAVSGYGGVGQFRGSLQVPQIQYIAGGAMNFRAHAHMLTAAVDRRISDIYGIGGTSTIGVSGSWRWDRRVAWMALGMGWTRISSITFPATALHGNFEVGRRIAGSFGLSAGYAYMAYQNTPLLTGSLLGQHAVRIALSWMPHSRSTPVVRNTPADR